MTTIKYFQGKQNYLNKLHTGRTKNTLENMRTGLVIIYTYEGLSPKDNQSNSNLLCSLPTRTASTVLQEGAAWDDSGFWVSDRVYSVRIDLPRRQKGTRDGGVEWDLGDVLTLEVDETLITESSVCGLELRTSDKMGVISLLMLSDMWQEPTRYYEEAKYGNLVHQYLRR